MSTYCLRTTYVLLINVLLNTLILFPLDETHYKKAILFSQNELKLTYGKVEFKHFAGSYTPGPSLRGKGEEGRREGGTEGGREGGREGGTDGGWDRGKKGQYNPPTRKSWIRH